MSKKREERRRVKQKTRARARPSLTKPQRAREPLGIPSAQTMWRTMHLDFRVQEKLIEMTLEAQPSLWKRDAGRIRRIEQAPDLGAVLELAPAATGLADYAWLKRMREFGASAAAEITARLQSDWMRSHQHARAGTQERLIGALRWCDDAGTAALTDCWDAFDDYGRSLACVALGLLAAQSVADRIWAFFERTRSAAKTYWIGALWGMIGVGDERAADALLDLLVEERTYYEQYGFLSLAGDQRAVVPLLAAIIHGPERLRADAMWALTGIAHRLGRERLAEVLRSEEAGQDTSEEAVATIVDRVFVYSQDDVERNFEAFYGQHASNLLTTSQVTATRH